MKLCNLFILAFTVLSLHALHPANASGDSYGSVLVDEVTSIYDGDTFRVNIKSWPEVIGRRVPVRIAGIDTAEMRVNSKEEKSLLEKQSSLQFETESGEENRASKY